MPTRTSRKTVTFARPFSLGGIDGVLPAGSYTVDTDEELIEGLSFLSYRRISTVIFLPSLSRRSSFVEAVDIDPADLEAAQRKDAAGDESS
ncbi:MAG: hypothetical protein M3145_14055 [Pseudomonadota bacterium]|nr:hypothetical protein [Pseudomonadota bacterium]